MDDDIIMEVVSRMPYLKTVNYYGEEFEYSESSSFCSENISLN